MRSNQPIADILLWDCDDHLEKKGGKSLVRQGLGQGDPRLISSDYSKTLMEVLSI